MPYGTLRYPAHSRLSVKAEAQLFRRRQNPKEANCALHLYGTIVPYENYETQVYVVACPLGEFLTTNTLYEEAGYEKGFKVVLDAPNGRYVNDAQVAQAIASQLSKIGVEVVPNLHPKTVFFDYVRPGDKSSLVMTGWSEPIDVGALANTLFYTRNKTQGKGTSNRGHYSNAEFDRLVDEADATGNVEKRAELLEEAARTIIDDVGVIPLYFNKDIYGKKSSVDFTPRMDKQILAQEIDLK